MSFDVKQDFKNLITKIKANHGIADLDPRMCQAKTISQRFIFFLNWIVQCLRKNLVIHLIAEQYSKLRKPNEFYLSLYKLKITSNFALFLSLVLLVGLYY